MNYDLTQTGPEVQAILDKAALLPQSPGTVIAGKIDAAVSVTYSELKSLRDQGGLKPGQMYRITDYVTTTTQAETKSAGHPFDVLVLAASPASLSETAYAARHDGDTYFQNCKMEAWQLKYCLDNDTARFAWADAQNGKGVIWWMKDEWGNECPYDFKNIMFTRRLCTEIEEVELENMDGDSNTFETRVQIIIANTNSEKFLTDAQILGRGITGYTITDASGRTKAEDWLYWTLDSSDEFYKAASSSVWASDNAQHRAMRVGPAFEVKYTLNGRSQTGYAFPALVRQDGVTVDLYTFNSSDDDYTIDPEAEMEDYSLNGRDHSVYDNVLAFCSDGLNSTVFIGSNNYGIRLGTNCFKNTFGYSCYEVKWGSDNKYNSWGNENNYSSWGNDNYSSSWGNNNYSSSWGNGNYYSSWGNYNQRSSWGNENYYSSWGNENYYSSWGNYNQRSSWGNNNYNSSWGNYNQHSSWGNSNDSSSWGNGNGSSSWGNNNRNTTYFNGIQYTVLGDEVQNAQVLEGTSGTSSAPLTLNFATGESYCQVAGKDSSGVLRIWVPADLVA